MKEMNAAAGTIVGPGIIEEGLTTQAVLAMLYIVSFYAFMDNNELSWSSFSLGIIMLGAMSYRHLFVRSLRFPRLFLIPWLFLLLNVVSLSWARDTAQAIDEIKAISSAIIAASAIWLALLNGVPVRIVLLGFIFGSLVLIGASLGELANFVGTDRLSSLVGNSNTMAMYLSYPSMLAWNLQGEKMGRWRLICSGLVLFAFIFTGSRRMLPIAAVQCAFLLVYVLAHYKGQALWRWLGLSFAALLALVLVVNWDAVTESTSEFLGANQVLARTGKLDENREGSSVYIRERMVSVGLQLWAKQPIEGHGAGQFMSLSGFGMYAHNNYVELLANDGIIGLVLYYTLPAAMLFWVLRPRKHSPFSVETRLNVVITLLAVLVLDVVTVTLRSKGYWVFLVSLAAALQQMESVDEIE
jgi:hypothetical protein